VIPEFFSPSSFIGFSGCKLRLASRLATGIERLPSGPAAALGRLHHGLLEAGAKGELDGTEEPRLRAKRSFDLAVDRVSEEVRAQGGEHWLPLQRTRSPRSWMQFEARTLRQLTEVLERRGAGGATRRSRAAEVRAGAEVALESQRLRLRGRADSIERVSTDELLVRDFKSGRILDAEGRIQEHIAIQLRLYGAICKEREPKLGVRLIVDDGDEHEVSFSEAERSTTENELLKFLAELPAGESRDASSLAKVGAECARCDLRPLCGSYVAEAPRLWSEGAAALPMDTWGTVVGIQSQPGGCELTLEDAAGRGVKVTGLDAARFEFSSLERGHRIYLFNLRSDSGRRGGHPRNFFEMPRSRFERRAWAMQAYADCSD